MLRPIAVECLFVEEEPRVKGVGARPPPQGPFNSGSGRWDSKLHSGWGKNSGPRIRTPRKPETPLWLGLQVLWTGEAAAGGWALLPASLPRKRQGLWVSKGFSDLFIFMK